MCGLALVKLSELVSFVLSTAFPVLRFEFVFLSFHLVYKFKLAGIDSSDTHTKEWYQVQAVLHVSLGNCLFFVVLALIMIGVKDQNDKRDSWHHGGWTVKIVIWLLLIVLAFFIPDSIMLAYGMLCSPHFLPLGYL